MPCITENEYQIKKIGSLLAKFFFKDQITVFSARADPGFEKGGGAEGSGVRFSKYLGQFRGLFKEFGTKRGGCAPPLWNKACSVCM